MEPNETADILDKGTRENNRLFVLQVSEPYYIPAESPSLPN